MKTKVEPLDSKRLKAIIADVRARSGRKMTHNGKPTPFKVGQKVGWRHGTWTVVDHDAVGSGYRLALVNPMLPALALYVNPEMVKLTTPKRKRYMPSEYVRREHTELGGLLQELRERTGLSESKGSPKLTDADNVIGEFLNWSVKSMPRIDFRRGGGSSSAYSRAEGVTPKGTSPDDAVRAIAAWLKGYGLKFEEDRPAYKRYAGTSLNGAPVHAGIQVKGRKIILSVMFSRKR